MKKKNNIQLKVLLLLLIYIFSNSPAIVFHHHHNHIVAFEKATSCEKAIYYSGSNEKCKHKSHLSESLKKCSLCHNHTISVHFSAFNFFNFFKLAFNSSYSTTTFDYKFVTSPTLSSRGPPTV